MPMPFDSTQDSCNICCCTLLSKILIIIFMVLLIIAILFGNSVTLAVFLGSKHFRSPQGYLKASLAVADLAVGVFVVPFSVYAEITLLLKESRDISFGDTFQLCTFIGPLFAGCTLVSISTIFLLTIERTMAIVKPLHKGAVITRKRTLVLIFLSWLCSFSLAMSPMLFSEGIELEYNSCSRMCNYAVGVRSRSDTGWNVLLLFPAFDFTLLGSTIVINILSLTTIRQHSQRRQFLAQPEFHSKVSRPSFSDIKAAKTIGTLTVAFTVSFTPIAVFVVGNVIGNEWCNFSFFAFWILTTNSCWNVIIYSVRDQKFRHRAHQLMVVSFIRKGSKDLTDTTERQK
ncbi:adenosine receptor A2a [Erpetoichthys calabaricus]|uniref:Adenosine receptor A2a-like n=1 Tax=Erpetoichthys calabaricus TaxID=27687 RepID=A0A8C4TKF3_ERPCA|nr:adenosine receptor A2a [Erpetoichthys calabaricus]